jgi:hypothetical protein
MMTKKEKPMLSVAAIIQAQGRWDRALAGKNTSEQRNIKNYCNKIEMVKYCSFPHHLFHLSRIKLFLRNKIYNETNNFQIHRVFSKTYAGLKVGLLCVYFNFL